MSEFSKEENKRLCDTYPFLIPYNRFTGKLITCEKGFWAKEPDKPPPEWDYEYTELDDMDEGWRKAFGEQMCAEIKEALLKEGGEELLNNYRVEQIKEKFGYLRWYDTPSIKSVQEIIRKYEVISSRTCVVCGKPATKLTKGWIVPVCDECGKTSANGFMSLDNTFV